MSAEETPRSGPRHWGHNHFFSAFRGQVKLYCRCGWQSRKVPAEQSAELVAEHVAHTGLIERQRKPH
jgi:hypothetical protein